MLGTPQTLVLRLQKPKNDKKVQWDEAVVDNEHMGKKKSKCESSLFFLVHQLHSGPSTGCCIYEKPRGIGESDSESDGDGDGDCCHEHRVARSRVPRQHEPHNT